MTPAAKHRFGASLMWTGAGICALSALAVIPAAPWTGAWGMALGVVAATIGAWHKKRYCPRCRAKSRACQP